MKIIIKIGMNYFFYGRAILKTFSQAHNAPINVNPASNMQKFFFGCLFLSCFCPVLFFFCLFRSLYSSCGTHKWQELYIVVISLTFP